MSKKDPIVMETYSRIYEDIKERWIKMGEKFDDQDFRKELIDGIEDCLEADPRVFEGLDNPVSKEEVYKKIFAEMS